MDPSNLQRWERHFLREEAATLAMMREAPHDIRPELLLLFHAGACEYFHRVHQHGTLYLRARCAMRETPQPPWVLEAAAGDALAMLWARRAPRPVSQRARQFGVRNATYSLLRKVALAMYQARLHEARVRFISGTTYTRRSLQWKVGNAPSPPAPGASAEN